MLTGTKHPALLLLLAALMATTTLGQGERYRWQGFWLHPEEATRSYATAIDGDIPSGWAPFVPPTHAVIWPEWTQDFVSLIPSGAADATLGAADGGYQVGQVTIGYQDIYPAIWSGSPESVIDMTPVGPYISWDLYARQGDQTVGYVYHITSGSHAGLWLNNDPDQFIDLHFASADWSEAHATDGTWQGGRAAFPGVGIRAVLWKGNPSTHVIMGPGEHLYGWIRGMAPGTQVGEYMNGTKFAVLWHDTPESWITMSPTDANSAALYATIGDLHVGYASTPGTGNFAHAGIWYGDDPDSFFDLHKFVPEEYADDGSIALDIDTVDGVIYITGSVNVPLARAFMWVGVPIDSTDQDNQGPKTPNSATRIGKP